MLVFTANLAEPNEAHWEREDEAARVFYCELLDAREIAPGCFVIGGVLIETGHERRGQTARAPVEHPEEVAARCWNAGYTVVVDDMGGASPAAAIGILDPFGLRIDFQRANTR